MPYELEWKFAGISLKVSKLPQIIFMMSILRSGLAENNIYKVQNDQFDFCLLGERMSWNVLLHRCLPLDGSRPVA